MVILLAAYNLMKTHLLFYLYYDAVDWFSFYSLIAWIMVVMVIAKISLVCKVLKCTVDLFALTS